ncbi:MAG: peptidoglycan-binding protein [Clostridium sp.]|uniref:peptidoglycan-binding protein n=1 Tax=Clostridium sp. TaxID=1506 RepID=UPI003F338CAD
MKKWLKSKKAHKLALDNVDNFYNLAKKKGVNPSVLLCQAMIETGWMKFGGVLTAEYKNTCGLKNSKGGGCLDPNAHAKFKSWEDGIEAHAEHLALYAGKKGYPLKRPKDPRHFDYLYGKCKTVEELSGTWAMDESYSKKIIKLVNELEGGKNNMKINDMFIKYNFSTGRSKVQYIVIHTTGNTGRGSGVDNHFNYFNGGNRQASADYFVDDKKIGKFVGDNNYSWAVGDGKGKYGISNSNSVSIEICVNSDGDYNKTIANTVELTKFLMKKYNLPISKVVQHYDASRKQCPAEIRAGKNGITWSKFISMVNGASVPTNSGSSSSGTSSKKLWEVSISGELIKELQSELNKQCNARLTVDGYFGDSTLDECITVKQGAKGNITKIIQKRLNALGYTTNGIDGIFGGGTHNAVIKFQKAKNLSADGIVGKNTWKALMAK